MKVDDLPLKKAALRPFALARRVWQRALDRIPIPGFHFDRPLVLFQSDDWGRVGLRDREGLEQLQSSGLALGERPYDFYTLETANDIAALIATLKRHRDSMGRHPCLEMNFIVGNPDFAKMEAKNWREVVILPLAEGLPAGWSRPGLNDAYRIGISDGVLRPELHGITHFCRPAVERTLPPEGERSDLLRTFWRAGTPYIHWRMPWIGYEYWDPEKDVEDRFLQTSVQAGMIGQAVGAFAKMFSRVPASACAPGYRANSSTLRAWAQHGIKIVQNGPGAFVPPHFDGNEVLHLFRNLDFEPALDPNLSLGACLQALENCFARGLPAVISLHSINFHSTVKDFRASTLQLLDEFLTILERRYTGLLYVHDADLRDLIQHGCCYTAHGDLRVNVIKKTFTKSAASVKPCSPDLQA
ncbi:MAG TPA: hypothetical protein VMU05_12610 [Dongiaceae bacterium]|nr:hypothetical protein [Dongiaceae bacterium]